MRSVFVPALKSHVSVLGFGCASLGSRVGRDAGLEALDRAYAAGVTWYDVAPSYGDGEAEINLASFISGKRETIQICTKVGILPARTPWLMRQIKPIARAIVKTLPALRRVAASNRPMAIKTTLTPELIVDSLHGSLCRLGTDYVDVLALHAATKEEVQNEEVLFTLEKVISQGKVRTISIASSLEAGLAALKVSQVYGIVQVSNNPFEPNVITGRAQAERDREFTFVTHSAYGSYGALDRLTKLLAIENSQTRKEAKALGYHGSNSDIAAGILLDYALKSNVNGICLLSMFRKAHFDFNLRALNRGEGNNPSLDCFIAKWIR